MSTHVRSSIAMSIFSLIHHKNLIGFIVCACAILKDRPVCYGTSRLKSRVCAVTRCALLKTPTLKSNKRKMPIDNPLLEISSHIG